MLNAVVVAVLAALGLVSCGGEDDSPSKADFTPADLERLSFAPEDLPDMDYQADRSGRGAFTAGDENREIAAKLDDLGFKADYVSQFFATSRKSDPLFVESTSLLFGDEATATSAMRELEEAALDNLDDAEPVDDPIVGSDPFGVRGKFEGFTAYTFGWRIGDAVQLLTAAPNEENPRSGRVLELADQLAAKAEEAS